MRTVQWKPSLKRSWEKGPSWPLDSRDFWVRIEAPPPYRSLTDRHTVPSVKSEVKHPNPSLPLKHPMSPQLPRPRPGLGLLIKRRSGSVGLEGRRRIRRMWYWSELWKTPQWLALPWQKHQRCKAYKPAITVRALACLREERRSGSESDGFGASRPHFVPEELLQIFARSWALASPRALEALSATEAAPGVFRLRVRLASAQS